MNYKEMSIPELKKALHETKTPANCFRIKKEITERTGGVGFDCPKCGKVVLLNGLREGVYGHPGCTPHAKHLMDELGAKGIIDWERMKEEWRDSGTYEEWMNLIEKAAEKVAVYWMCDGCEEHRESGDCEPYMDWNDLD